MEELSWKASLSFIGNMGYNNSRLTSWTDTTSEQMIMVMYWWFEHLSAILVLILYLALLYASDMLPR